MIVATVLTVYGIETPISSGISTLLDFQVATVLTVYGIETFLSQKMLFILMRLLQQYLPFTVLKLKRSYRRRKSDD